MSATLGDARPAPAQGLALRRGLFWAAALAGAAIFWLARHPPMVDLPQHAGQVMLMRDLLLGQGRWAEVMRLNWFTPYLIGYGLALPLSLVMPMAAALKLLLSLSYLGFVLLCVRLGRHFGSDPRLDPLYLLGFFGIASKWGFLTFLVAAPLTLAFVLLASHYARDPGPRRGLAVFGLGLLLLASHGLAFLFGWGVGAALLLGALWRGGRRRLPVAALPFAALMLCFAAYFVASRLVESDFKVEFAYWKGMDYSWARLIKGPLYAISDKEDRYLLAAPALALLAVPFLLGLRLRRWHWEGAVPLAVVVAILLLVPSFALNTAFLYERFALFLLPALAWAFPAAGRDPRPPGPRRPRLQRAGTALLLLLTAGVLALYAARNWRFGQETRGIDAAIRSLAPGERALALVFEFGSPATHNPFVYIHYPAWYQAERGGLVDFNFGWFPPQIVRFRPDKAPRITPGFEWTPHLFDWRRHEGWRYRYFFVHGAQPPGLFDGAPCPPARVWSEGLWSIYENRACAARGG